jgi:hypothetical protein
MAAVGNSPVLAKIQGDPEKELLWRQVLDELERCITLQGRLAARRRALKQVAAHLRRGRSVLVVRAMLEDAISGEGA